MATDAAILVPTPIPNPRKRKQPADPADIDTEDDTLSLSSIPKRARLDSGQNKPEPVAAPKLDQPADDRGEVWHSKHVLDWITDVLSKNVKLSRTSGRKGSPEWWNEDILSQCRRQVKCVLVSVIVFDGLHVQGATFKFKTQPGPEVHGSPGGVRMARSKTDAEMSLWRDGKV